MFTYQIKFDDQTDLEVYIWAPETEENVKGVIQIVHGMAEYMPRYNEFASFLSYNGYVVIGCDLYAHGKTCGNPDEVGVVTRYDFMMSIMKSVKMVYEEVGSRFYELPHYLFAHSMGSLVAQRYIELYPDDFEKVILSGTDYPGIKYVGAKVLSKLFMKKNYVKYSKFIDNLGAGGFNKKFKNEHQKYAWLSRDLNTALKYENDPYCGKMFPVDYYYSLSRMLVESHKKANILKINPGILIQIMSGSNDPVGGFGKGPKQLSNCYNKNGIATRLILYPDARHECINEIPGTKEKFFNDALAFYDNII
ncbi:MAG: alpha/beta hydrolase [Bacilli bacterium]|nr:alpha/beta hydrolase [Bacilli bacterium]